MYCGIESESADIDIFAGWREIAIAAALFDLGSRHRSLRDMTLDVLVSPAFFNERWFSFRMLCARVEKGSPSWWAFFSGAEDADERSEKKTRTTMESLVAASDDLRRPSFSFWAAAGATKACAGATRAERTFAAGMSCVTRFWMRNSYSYRVPRTRCFALRQQNLGLDTGMAKK